MLVMIKHCKKIVLHPRCYLSTFISNLRTPPTATSVEFDSKLGYSKSSSGKSSKQTFFVLIYAINLENVIGFENHKILKMTK